MPVGHAYDYVQDHAKKAMDKALGSNQEPIYVLRHGRTALDALHRSDGWLDFPLTDEGRRGLIPAQQYLKDIPKPLVCIYASSLKRVMETAEIIQSGMGIDPPEIEVDDRIRTWNMGRKLLGSQKYPAKPIVQYYMRHPDETPEGGESLNAFNTRFQTWFDDMVKEKRAGPVLVVLSGSAIRELSQYIEGDRESLDLDEGGLMEIQPTGDGCTAHVILGGKSESDEEEPVTYGS